MTSDSMVPLVSWKSIKVMMIKGVNATIEVKMTISFHLRLKLKGRLVVWVASKWSQNAGFILLTIDMAVEAPV